VIGLNWPILRWGDGVALTPPVHLALRIRAGAHGASPPMEAHGATPGAEPFQIKVNS
jgi:hypothetical protein